MKIQILRPILLSSFILLKSLMLHATEPGKDLTANKPNPKKTVIIAQPASTVLEQQAMVALNEQLKGLSLNGSVGFKPSASFFLRKAVLHA